MSSRVSQVDSIETIATMNAVSVSKANAVDVFGSLMASIPANVSDRKA